LSGRSRPGRSGTRRHFCRVDRCALECGGDRVAFVLRRRRPRQIQSRSCAAFALVRPSFLRRNQRAMNHSGASTGSRHRCRPWCSDAVRAGGGRRMM
jgi:hypothetical protein